MTEQALLHKLAAILYADVEGYSRLTGADEAGTHRTLSAYLDLFAETIRAHRGEVKHYAGDAVLADFTTVSDALNCAVAVQRLIKEKNQEVPDDKRVQFRIGLNLGEVIVDRGEVYGNGVNVAARLETLAEPGGICVSGTVVDAIGTKLPLSYDFLGEQPVKNIDKPVRAYQVNLTGEPFAANKAAAAPPKKKRARLPIAMISALFVAGAAIAVWQFGLKRPTVVAQTTDPVLAIPTGPAIAVLALQNMSGDATQDYFADGIAEEIIARLSRFTAFRVLARNSTFQFKGRSVDVRQIGREIGANYVVEGSVRKAGSQVRVTVQLLDATNGAHLWAETYERDLTVENLFAVQDEITDQIVTRIGDVHGAIGRAEVKRLRTKSSASLADYECLLFTYEYQRFLTPDKHVSAKECLSRTVERNPDYAEAWANLAYAYTDQYWGDYPGPPNPLERAYDAARRAVQLDPTSQIAHYALANVYFFRNDLSGFFVEAEKALAINPNNTEVVAALGVRITYAEKSGRGVALIRKAMALNPAHPGWYWFPIAYDHFRTQDYHAAVEAARRVDMPGFWYMHLWLAAAYGALGDTERGRAALANIDAINPAFKHDPVKYLRLWFKSEEAVQQFVSGLRKSGLEISSDRR